MTQEKAVDVVGTDVAVEDPRILVVAEHASARFGGEAILPLHIFQRLRRRGIDAQLVVHARTRGELEALLPDDRDRMHFIPDTRAHKLLNSMGKRLPARVGYFSTGLISRIITGLYARRIVKRLVSEYGVDVVHQPIPVSPREPSMIYGVGAPVVIGPMNGGMSYPPSFRGRESSLVSAYLGVGRFAAGLMHWLMPGKLRADVLLVANERSGKALPAGIRGEVQTIIENGVDLKLWPPAEPTSTPGEPLRVVFMGRLVDWKAVDLLLEAMRDLVARTPARLTIVGDGPMRPQLEAQAAELGLSDKIDFIGWLSQPDCAELLKRSDVLVLPSLLECGGAVVLEAMSMALPVVASDWGGPADYVDETCGILVTPTSRQEFIVGLTDALARLAASPELRRTLGLAGRERIVREFDWDKKIERMLEVYEPLIRARRASKP